MIFHSSMLWKLMLTAALIGEALAYPANPQDASDTDTTKDHQGHLPLVNPHLLSFRPRLAPNNSLVRISQEGQASKNGTEVSGLVGEKLVASGFPGFQPQKPSVQTIQLWPPVGTTPLLVAYPSSHQALSQQCSSGCSSTVTSVATTTSSLPPYVTPDLDQAVPTVNMDPNNIFAKPVDTKPPPSSFTVKKDHPVPRKGIQSKAPLQTNKFFANFFLGDQRCPSYTFPYSLTWVKGNGSAGSWGIAVSHTGQDKIAYGNEKDYLPGVASYYINPVGIEHMILSAKELSNHTALSMDSVTDSSARIHLSTDEKSSPAISFPLVQGMPYITAQYSGTTPLIQTGVFYKGVTKVARDIKQDVSKFTFTLEDGSTWRLYAHNTKGPELTLKVTNNSCAEATGPFTGTIQIVKDPMTPGSEAMLDDGAGIYPVTSTLSGSTNGKDGTYRFDFSKAGHGTGNLYMYALPHHVSSFNNETASRASKAQISSTTKGLVTLVKGNNWTMVEPNMPINMDFAPWHPQNGTMTKISDRAKDIIGAAAHHELTSDMDAQTNLDSMYFSGKAHAKFAQIIYVVNDLLGNKALAQNALGRLKAAFGRFVANKQQFPLYYEGAWGGVVSSATYLTGNEGADFGNTYYNDHHFHYGYLILTGALIGHLDPEWLKDNAEYINILVRDIANPSKDDKFFPMWRNFDWYHGHSWAHGLYPAADGKNQESSSEDMMAAFALKMWGKVNGDKNLEARANLQLAVMSRTFPLYYLYQKNNTVQPARFIGNKVAGILFENKADHATFFSADIECIQGIHMIPLLAPSPYLRSAEFVREEWDTYFSNGRIDNIRNGWTSILYANYATIEPKKAWEFFSSKDFKTDWLDQGASHSWFLAYAAALGEI